MEIIDSILEVLNVWGKMLPMPLEDKQAWAKRLRGIDRRQLERGIRHLSKRGLVKIKSKNDLHFATLTATGQLEVLLKKAKLPIKEKWDGKWRLIIFDIPEDSKQKRQLFRSLLKSNGFYKLQASVYINPYPLNRSAIAYLKDTGLVEYIRLLRVDQMDSDAILKKHFKLA